MCNSKNLVKLILLMVIFCSFSIPLAAQDVRTGLFKEADAALQKAKDVQAELLSPKNYQEAMEYYNEAESDLKEGKNLEDIRRKLQAAVSYFQKAIQATQLAELTFQNLMKVRSDALNANASDYAGDSWNEAEKKFTEAAIELEDGDVNEAKKIGGEAEILYRKAELEAIKTNYLNETWALLEQADNMDVKDRAPKTLQNAKELAAQAEKELNENRYDTDKPRNLAKQAKYEAKHAIYLATTIQNLEDSDQVFEDVYLAGEGAMRQIGAALDLNVEFDEGFDKPAEQIVQHIHIYQDSTTKLSQIVAEQDQKIAQYEQELGGLTQERTELKKSIEAQDKIREQFTAIGKTLTREEAQVLRDGNDIIIRMVGLIFDVGKSVIKPEHFGLLTKVQNAIKTFPDCKISVEGHTDSFGSDASNLNLSQERADAVKAYILANMSMDSSRIEAIGYGESKPIANNETTEGRAKNRRIEIVIHPISLGMK
jgi:outer membrane protein OmpA-like peptidoglycan-associated protein